MPAYPGRVVLRIMYNQSYRVMSFNAFWKFGRLRNSAWYFLGAGGGGGGVKCLVEEFFGGGGFGSPRNFLGFDFCSHSIIPEALSIKPKPSTV